MIYFGNQNEPLGLSHGPFFPEVLSTSGGLGQVKEESCSLGRPPLEAKQAELGAVRGRVHHEAQLPCPLGVGELGSLRLLTWGLCCSRSSGLTKDLNGGE